MFSLFAQRTAQRASTFYTASYTRSRVTSMLPLRTQTFALSTTANLLAAVAKGATAAGARKPASTKKTGTGAKGAKKSGVKSVKKPAKTKPPTLKTMKIAEEALPPKAPLNNYLIFAMEYMKAHPKRIATESSKEASKAWHALSDAQKAVYTDRAVAMRQKYRVHLQAYMQTVDPKLLRAINIQRRAKGKFRARGSSAATRKPLTGFTLFIRENARTVEYPSEMPGLQKGQFMINSLAKRWSELPEAEKTSYRFKSEGTA